ncbi:RNA-guided endonuclease InsQ/TnpB family protein [Paeniglutamicibacter sp. NPDC091659]|uniref:RNA-guided endonuclease InsQ/TnpB family protein n=1 Tax=Paeniglutamicibacter sp. NPDC091659 TaxID=3364389 RepID=UPI0037F29938
MKRYRYRLYPNLEQQNQLARTFGCARVVFNDVVAASRTAWRAGEKPPSVHDLMKVMSRSKKSMARAWLGEVSSVALQQSMLDADTARRNFYAGLSGTGVGKRVGAPRFKSRKDHRDAFRITGRSNFDVRKVSARGGQVRLPKAGWIHFALSRELPEKPSSLTVIREPDGRYYVSFVLEAPEQTGPGPIHKVAGIDLGLEYLAVIAYDDGTSVKVENPRHLKRSCGNWRQRRKSCRVGKRDQRTGRKPA